MSQKGFVQLLVPIGIAAALIIGGTIFYSVNRNGDSETSPLPSASVIPSPEASPSPSVTASLRPSIRPSAKPSVKASATPKPTSTPAASNNPSPSPNAPAQSSSPHPTPTPATVVCEVHFNPTSGTAPVNVQLIYGAAFSYQGDYVTNVQWDWDGDGNWDTDMSLNNQHLTHTYDKAGTYNARMHLQTNQGKTTEVCSGSITIN